ncbi:hypothetical protein P7C73_g3083, partial [Tremellales sp. Uapishka_1]
MGLLRRHHSASSVPALRIKINRTDKGKGRHVDEDAEGDEEMEACLSRLLARSPERGGIVSDDFGRAVVGGRRSPPSTPHANRDISSSTPSSARVKFQSVAEALTTLFSPRRSSVSTISSASTAPLPSPEETIFDAERAWQEVRGTQGRVSFGEVNGLGRPQAEYAERAAGDTMGWQKSRPDVKRRWSLCSVGSPVRIADGTDDDMHRVVWFVTPSEGHLLSARDLVLVLSGEYVATRLDDDERARQHSAQLGRSYLYLAPTSYTAPGATPDASATNEFTQNTGIAESSESSIVSQHLGNEGYSPPEHFDRQWTYNAADNSITPQWVNPDGSTPTNYLVYDSSEEALVIVGDVAAFERDYNSGNSLPTVYFEFVSE